MDETNLDGISCGILTCASGMHLQKGDLANHPDKITSASVGSRLTQLAKQLVGCNSF